MSTTRKTTKTLAVGAIAASAAALMLTGASPANAAPVPTIAVGLAGDSDWQITYHRGAMTRDTTRCRVWMDDRIVASPERELAETQKAEAKEAEKAKKKKSPNAQSATDRDKPGAKDTKKDKKPAPPTIMTTTLKGDTVAPGAHRVNVRCGKSVSPTIWLIAPRNQIWDTFTWLSNGTAGIIGY